MCLLSSGLLSCVFFTFLTATYLSKAQCSLFVLRVPLNPNQSISQFVHSCRVAVWRTRVACRKQRHIVADSIGWDHRRPSKRASAAGFAALSEDETTIRLSPFPSSPLPTHTHTRAGCMPQMAAILSPWRWAPRGRTIGSGLRMGSCSRLFGLSLTLH